MKRRVGQYLMDCLSEMDVEKIFGVPGDFNLAFLDDIISHDKVEWVGNTNELNGSYAADGYARMKGLSALVTTFGVGELSAVNGIAGSYAERVPVIAITGAPTTASEQAGNYVHHSLGEGIFDSYRKMFKEITTDQGYITTDNATTEIPRLINAALAEKRPVHLHLPIDVALSEIEVEETFKPQLPEAQDVSKYIDIVKAKLENASKPVILTGHEINSFDLHDELLNFAEEKQIPVAQLSLGKGAFNEESDYYIGMYDGSVAEPNLREYVDNSDAILNIGAKLTDSATAGFSYEFEFDEVIMLNHHDFKCGDEKVTDIRLPDILRGLNDMDYKNDNDFPEFEPTIEGDAPLNDEPLTQENYFRMLKDFVSQDDVILADQGTSFFGAYSLRLTKDNTFIGQPLWGSIGYTLPATLGSQIADEGRRNLLLIGDGSLQLTVQDISTMIKEGIKPVLFVINNDGYTVERKIHGETAPYNDIPMWDYKKLPEVFGAKDQVKVHDVESTNDLKRMFEAINAQGDYMHLAEIKMAKQDAPEKLEKISKAFAALND
ncbi:alpha-keto acid decarboxylase family protein [Staphylococcus massiliensis]|uniref:alpha-keto acid decarboxylase family protein n=1 Tax=Staphylococcus massiliensis TaxID=555791 RepID=UPI001EE14848|nr:alpha-keto acid decarboxylase family protein [Staphylococcus massiliensis]MCG3399167.1 alpha-keto acid decarboxylase family protein [Staphylococcus massiliensis]